MHEAVGRRKTSRPAKLVQYRGARGPAFNCSVPFNAGAGRSASEEALRASKDCHAPALVIFPG
eukprot:1935440-Prymnesium_polylepis.1